MPRGNDAQAALAELADNFGDGVGRAEELIAASRARYSGLLRTAQLQPVDAEAKEQISKADVAKSADLDENEVLDYAVHGQGRDADKTVIVVYNDERGETHKEAIPFDLIGKAPSTVEKAVAEDEGDAPAPKRSSRKKS